MWRSARSRAAVSPLPSASMRWVRSPAATFSATLTARRIGRDDGAGQQPRAHGAEQHGDAGQYFDHACAVAVGVVDVLGDGVDVVLLHLDQLPCLPSYASDVGM